MTAQNSECWRLGFAVVHLNLDNGVTKQQNWPVHGQGICFWSNEAMMTTNATNHNRQLRKATTALSRPFPRFWQRSIQERSRGFNRIYSISQTPVAYSSSSTFPNYQRPRPTRFSSGRLHSIYYPSYLSLSFPLKRFTLNRMPLVRNGFVLFPNLCKFLPLCTQFAKSSHNEAIHTAS